MGCERKYPSYIDKSTQVLAGPLRPQRTREFVTPANSIECLKESAVRSELALDCTLEKVIDDTFREMFILAVMEIAGGHFRGIHRGDEDTPWLVLFDGPDNSTLAIRLEDLSVEAVRAKLAESAELFAQVGARDTKAQGASL